MEAPHVVDIHYFHIQNATITPYYIVRNAMGLTASHNEVVV